MELRARLIGYPRIGPNRELKRALEKAWSGRMETDAFLSRVAELRGQHLAEQRDAIGSAVDDYFLYDAVLETAMMLYCYPELVDRSKITDEGLAKFPPYDLFPGNPDWVPASGALSPANPTPKRIFITRTVNAYPTRAAR